MTPPRRKKAPQLHFLWPSGDTDAPVPACEAESTSDGSGDPAGSTPMTTTGLPSPAEKSSEPENAELEEAYGPGHPWHYFERGDHATPPPPSRIAPNDTARSAVDRDLPKQPAKRIVAARSLLERDQAKLAETIREYEAVVERGADALSQYDREIAYRGDLEMARAGTIAILYNQIAWWRGRVQALERETDRGTSRRR
jgi:hypothetical protein